jgi:hypothetical protein
MQLASWWLRQADLAALGDLTGFQALAAGAVPMGPHPRQSAVGDHAAECG